MAGCAVLPNAMTQSLLYFWVLRLGAQGSLHGLGVAWSGSDVQRSTVSGEGHCLLQCVFFCSLCASLSAGGIKQTISGDSWRGEHTYIDTRMRLRSLTSVLYNWVILYTELHLSEHSTAHHCSQALCFSFHLSFFLSLFLLLDKFLPEQVSSGTFVKGDTSK
jgi:hypothetical protein